MKCDIVTAVIYCYITNDSLRENVTLAAFQHKGVSDYILCIAQF